MKCFILKQVKVIKYLNKQKQIHEYQINPNYLDVILIHFRYNLKI